MCNATLKGWKVSIETIPAASLHFNWEEAS